MSDSSSSDSVIDENIRRDFEEEAKNITNDLLPAKSCMRYNQCYAELKQWCDVNKTNSFSEDVLLVYFKELSQRLKPSTLWSRWSMLRSVVNLKHDININHYQKLKALIKNKAKGFHSKQSLVLKWDEITKFLSEAADCMYLAIKVVLIFGISGALRSGEFCSINCNNVEDTGSQYIITVKDTKNYYRRTFVIAGQSYEKVHAYADLRPSDLATDRFFIQYLNGKCVRQVIGKNKISEMPKIIATYLHLPEPERYTVHCFRRTAATLLSNAGANLQILKELGGWRSSTVTEKYIEKSIGNKQKIFEQLVSASNQSTATNRTSTILADKISTLHKKPLSNTDLNNQNNPAQNFTETRNDLTNNLTEIPNDLAQEFESDSIADFLPDKFYTDTSSHIKIPVTSTVTSNDFSIPSTSTAHSNISNLHSQPLNQKNQDKFKMPLKSITNNQFNKPYSKIKCNEKSKEKQTDKNENDLDQFIDPTKLTMKHVKIKNFIINYNCDCNQKM